MSHPLMLLSKFASIKKARLKQASGGVKLDRYSVNPSVDWWIAILIAISLVKYSYVSTSWNE
jgi:hypothetical protein